MPNIPFHTPTVTSLSKEYVSLENIGLDSNIDLYNRMVRPSFSNVVGDSTIVSGGYVGRALALFRSHLTDMKKKKELSNSEAGDIFKEALPMIFTSVLQFETQQLDQAIRFTRGLLENEKISQEIQLAKAQTDKAFYDYSVLSPLQRELLIEQVNDTHSAHLLKGIDWSLKNIEAGGNGIDVAINSEVSKPKHETDEARERYLLTKFNRINQEMIVGGDGTDKFDYSKSHAYLERLKIETELGNSGEGINLSKATETYKSQLVRLQGVNESIKAGGDGSGDYNRNETLLPYQIIDLKSKLGDRGNGINLEESLAKYQTDQVRSESLLRELQAKDLHVQLGGSGDLTTLIDASDSESYYKKLLTKWSSEEERLKAMDIHISLGGDGDLDTAVNSDNSIQHWKIEDLKSQSELRHFQAIIENITAGGTGDLGAAVDPSKALVTCQIKEMCSTAELKHLQAIGEHVRSGGDGNLDNPVDSSKSVYAYQLKQIEAQSELDHLKAISEHVRAGGSGNLTEGVDASQSVAQAEVNLRKYQALIEQQKAGADALGNVSDGDSTIYAQRDSIKAQTALYTRQEEAFDERNKQQVLEILTKYNMMVFPDNTDAQNQIPETTKKTYIDDLIGQLV